MSYDTSYTGNCPAKYLKLRNYLVDLFEKEQRNFRRELSSYIKETYPSLYAKTKLWNGLFDVTKLFNVLNLPLVGKCGLCNKVTDLNPDTLTPRKFCSCRCSARSDKTREKCKKTCIRNFGVPNPSSRKGAANDKFKAYFEKTGYASWSSNPEVKRKKVETSRKNWGTDHPFQSEEVQKTLRRRSRSKYGCDHPSQSSIVRERYKAKTGYESPMQNPAVLEKSLKSSGRRKLFIDKRGKHHLCQGYEPIVLEFLDQHPSVKRFSTKTGTWLLPTIPWDDQGRIHIYHPDIGVILHDGRRLIIEVKSEYTLWKHETINRKKFKAASTFCTEDESAFWLVVVNDATKELHWQHR